MEKCKRKARIKETLEIVLLIFLLLLLFGSGVLLCLLLKPIPLAIAAGGGSVKNYIDSTYKDSSNNSVRIESMQSNGFPKSVYINVPSEYGWTLLKEEIDRFKDDPKHRPFLYICLSADSIDRDSRNKIGLTEEKSDQAHIYGYHVGDDPLMVYIADAANGETTISVDTLKEKIKPFYYNKQRDTVYIKQKDTVPSKKLFATSRKSGTLRRYENILGVSFDSISNTLFYDTDKLKDSDVAVVLGSSFYRPKIENWDNEKWLNVVDMNGHHIKKPLFIYFVVFEKEDNFKPNKQIIDFFEKVLNVKDLKQIKEGNVERGKLISYIK